ncbi:site-2 protease family protein [Stenomitos frigidus]|uniref:Zinc metalloprotease n=1 Tax=Stenomitos frigidus ULC18 TaxID=2107698 RepID=A0A2T1E1C3_9CYAN|nr:site-2 protease family protein [Stenomitos frigidus]PSB26501.1 site-2 protease family protein [Stenomitos frigidus ULC18]
MQSGWRVGSLFGIPFFIDPSWVGVLFLIAIPTGLRWQEGFPQWGVALAYGMGVVMALLLFSSVVLHELGHSLVAKAQGIKVNSITLFLFGGIAAIEQESKTPGKAFQVAIAGPAVSLSLAALLGGITYAIPDPANVVKVLATDLAWTNFILALFNLIPGLPLDGGQVLKAAVWKVTGSRFKGIHWAARTGKILGWLAILWGTFSLVRGDYSGLWIAFLGWFGVRNATSYDRMTDLQEALLQITAADAMTRDFRVVDADMSLRQFADTYLLDTARPTVYFAASNGRYRGLVTVTDLHTVERSEWETQTLYRLIKPLTEIPIVEETASLVQVIQAMESQQLKRVTVLSPAGAVAGIIDRGDVVRALTQKMKLPVSEALIKQIKEEGIYPPGFQLGAIAQAAAEALPANK